MTDTLKISLDAMGGDHGPASVVPAALASVRERDDLELILVGDEQRLSAELGSETHPRIHIQHASEAVGMDESPSRALRFKKDSSMRVAIDLVKEGRAQACVSAGNTGALMATARYVLKTLPGIDRPAICTAIPSMNGHTLMLDLGANVDSTAEHLFQFAVMGSVLAETVDGISNPRVGLLNIGEEEIKGNDQVKEAARRLAESNLNYIGFVEGDDIFTGDVDLVVCDGFVGNVALKASEGVARMIRQAIKDAYTANTASKLAGLLSRNVISSFRQRFDHRRYNGASLLGLREIVIKSHGGADAFAFQHAIEVAALEIVKRVPEQIDRQLENLFQERRAV